MANLLRMVNAGASIPAWQATGDFTIRAGVDFKSFEDLLLGLSTASSSYIAVFDTGELVVKPSAALFTGHTVTLNQYMELEIKRTGTATNNVTVKVGSTTVATGTDTGTVTLDAIGFNSVSSFPSATMDLYYLEMINGTDDRSYIATSNKFADQNQPDGTNDATFTTPQATYSFVEYSQGSGTVTANAGPNLNAEPNDPVILDGSASTSTGDPITSYTWTQVSPASPTVIIGNANNAIANFDAPNITEDFIFQLEVSNGASTDTDLVTVVVQQGVVAGTYNIVWDGDSRTFGTGSDPVLPVPDRVNDLLTPTPTFSNFGVGGQQTSDAQSTFNANVVPAYDDTKEFNIYVLNGFGINDCRLGRTSSAIIASLTDLAERAKALGYYVVIATIPPRDTSTASIEATRVAVNEWILTNNESSIDLRYDLNSDSRIGVWSSTYYSDISHLNYAGQDIWAENISIAIADEFVGLTTSAAPTNQPPTANAGPDQSVAAGSRVQLNASMSTDPEDGSISQFGWEQVDNGAGAVVLEFANTATPEFTAPSSLIAQTLEFRVQAQDSEGATSTDTVIINVAALEENAILSTMETLDFELVTQGNLVAYKGRANREVMQLKPSSTSGIVTAGGYLDVSNNGIVKVEIIADGKKISNENSDSIKIDGARILARLGDLDIPTGDRDSIQPTFMIVLYVGSDTRGLVVASNATSGYKPLSYRVEDAA